MINRLVVFGCDGRFFLVQCLVFLFSMDLTHSYLYMLVQMRFFEFLADSVTDMVLIVAVHVGQVVAS